MFIPKDRKTSTMTKWVIPKYPVETYSLPTKWENDVVYRYQWTLIYFSNLFPQIHYKWLPSPSLARAHVATPQKNRFSVVSPRVCVPD